MLALQKRLHANELMDAPGLDPLAHVQALHGLARINRTSRAPQQMARPILALARRLNRKSLTLLDLACGGADVPIQVALILKSHKIQTHLTLVDKSPTALATAAQSAARHNLSVTCLEGSAPYDLPPGPFNVVTNSLFLHHLTATTATATLAAMNARANYLTIVSDLRRSTLGFLIAWLGCRILSRSPIVHFDGPASVRAAFTPRELLQIATNARLSPRIQKTFPWRMLLTVKNTITNVPKNP